MHQTLVSVILSRVSADISHVNEKTETLINKISWINGTPAQALIVGHPSLLASLIVGASKCPAKASILLRFLYRNHTKKSLFGYKHY
jgi:hypothetical protein